MKIHNFYTRYQEIKESWYLVPETGKYESFFYARKAFRSYWLVSPGLGENHKIHKIRKINQNVIHEFSSDKYCESAVAIFPTVFQKEGRTLPSKCVKPLSDGCIPELDTTLELKADGL